MPFTILKGTFIPTAGYPDGDSVRFAPDDPAPLFMLPRRGFAPRINQGNGTIQLRYEGIDALEKQAREPFASDATARNLELIGSNPEGSECRGYILANQIGPNGRPICFVYAGDPSDQDGSSLFLDADRMRESVNFQLLAEGLLYPLFYDTLYGDLRLLLAEATINARGSGIGIWPDDRTQQGVTWGGASSLPDLAPIYPKLWRRLQKYTQDSDFRDESDTLDAFAEYLRMKNDRLLIVSEGRFTGLDNSVEASGDIVKLLYFPEDLVVVS